MSVVVLLKVSLVESESACKLVEEGGVELGEEFPFEDIELWGSSEPVDGVLNRLLVEVSLRNGPVEHLQVEGLGEGTADAQEVVAEVHSDRLDLRVHSVADELEKTLNLVGVEREVLTDGLDVLQFGVALDLPVLESVHHVCKPIVSVVPEQILLDVGQSVPLACEVLSSSGKEDIFI